MHAFRDNNKTPRDWEISVNVGTIRRVKALTKCDLMDVFKGNVMQELAGDPELLVNVLAALCKSQIEERGMTEEDFGCMFAGDIIEAASDALCKEIIDFFPNPHDRKNAATLAGKLEAVTESQRVAFGAMIDSGKIEKAVSKALESANKKFGEALESLELTHARLPTEN